MRDLQKKTIIATAGFLAAFLAGLAVYLTYQAQSDSPTSIRLARIEHNGSRPIFTSNISSLDTDEDLDFVHYVSPKQTWAGNHEGTLIKIYDNGKSWERIDLPVQGYVSSAYFSSESSGWLLLQQYDSSLDKTKFQATILHTEDGGRSWVSQFSSESLELVGLSFASPNELWVIGTKFSRPADTLNAELLLLHTSNGGNTWDNVSGTLIKEITSCSGTARYVYAIIQARQLGTLLFMSENGWRLSTSDGGVNWQCAGRFEPAGIRLQKFVGRTKELSRVLASEGGVHGSVSLLGIEQNDGSWIANSLSDVFLKDVLYVSNDELLACGSMVTNSGATNVGVALLSRDNGMSWSIIYKSSEATALNALARNEAGQVWAVGSNGSLVRFERTIE